jgi:hypothetical protein
LSVFTTARNKEELYDEVFLPIDRPKASAGQTRAVLAEGHPMTQALATLTLTARGYLPVSFLHCYDIRCSSTNQCAMSEGL